MRRLLLFSFAASLGAVSACSGLPPFPPDLITVKGQVTRNGVGVPNATVYGIDRSAIQLAIDGAFPTPPSSLTDGTGHFAFYGFGTTYDVVVSPPESSLDFTLVRGLTRRDPVVSLPPDPNAPVSSCHLDATWNPLPPADAKIAYFLTGPTYAGVQLVGVTPVDSDLRHGLTATWRGGTSTSMTLWTLVYDADATSGAPTSYVGYASAYTYLIANRVEAFSLSLQPVTTSPATLQIQTPDGYSVDDATVALDFGYETTGISLFHVLTPQGSPSFQMPNVPFNRIVASADASRGGETATAFGLGQVSEGQGATVTIVVPEAPALTSPDDGATIDSSTTFSFQSSEAQELTFSSTDANAPQFRIVTIEATASLSEITSLPGVAVPPGAHYSWRSRRLQSFATTDAFEAAGVDLPKVSYATSGARSFVVATPP